MKHITNTLLLGILLLTACQNEKVQPSTSLPPGPEVNYLSSAETESLKLPFSDAVRVGQLLYLSGQIGNLPGTLKLAEGGIQAETHQAMTNIKTILEANGSSLDHVFKVTVMLADIEEWPALNEVYVTYFPNHKPARSAFAGSGLALNARCEIEVIATLSPGQE
ncbi:MAG: Rid family detoxifying hydrolase [Mariniblastus sp.]|nr:Rid family detoxifying hydrolase [Mariniblastus sp.]